MSAVGQTGNALVEQKISASSPKPDICALLSTRPSSALSSRRERAKLRSLSFDCVISRRKAVDQKLSRLVRVPNGTLWSNDRSNTQVRLCPSIALFPAPLPTGP